MTRLPVDSTNIASIGYDPRTATLEIEFRHGGVYQYSGVAEATTNALLNAPSHGKYFNQHVKDSYVTRRVA
ncbi:KTSC domain-containing protein [Amycolatopsis sp. FDAARGOS 1241]|uniref:KTSC domain-containing protein n=1 Tax=Amycolatopsis sp. FDAARGOS 1241 TaxID=2778070 RepID=UPI00195251FB|nr:KTSC domain-containing protein [Amycolatopsis sp. FDAARGOS 1241]QRP43071.1 KTSC domain-containing protein [Amycolatopsis sp. FDAARGOS 1241]